MRILAALIAAVTTFAAGSALAQTRSQVWGSPLTQKTQTLYVQGDESMTSYNSQAANSQQTAGSTTYTVGGWAGEARTVGASFTSNDNDVNFALNGSRMHSTFRDVRAKARFGYVIPSIGFSLSEVNLQDKGGAKEVGLYGTGANAGLTIAVPLAQFLVVTADAMTVVSNEIFDKLNQGTTLGKRNEADLGAAYDITEKALQLLIGYRYRQYSIAETNQTFDERSQGAYVGLRLGVYF